MKPTMVRSTEVGRPQRCTSSRSMPGAEKPVQHVTIRWVMRERSSPARRRSTAFCASAGAAASNISMRLPVPANEPLDRGAVPVDQPRRPDRRRAQSRNSGARCRQGRTSARTRSGVADGRRAAMRRSEGRTDALHDPEPPSQSGSDTRWIAFNRFLARRSHRLGVPVCGRSAGLEAAPVRSTAPIFSIRANERRLGFYPDH